MIKKRKTVFIIIMVIIASLAVLLFVWPIMISRDWAFIDENTASRKGYREWIWGSRSRHWYQKSVVEVFIQEKYPNEFKQRWTSYAGTGRDIFERKVLYGHGRPGPVLQIHAGVLNEWFSELSDTEKKAFYDLLVTSDKDTIQKQINSMMHELMEKYSK